MLRLPGKNIAFAFSDPAAANACIALAEMFFHEKGHRPYLFSNRSYSGKELHNFHLVDSVPAIDDLKIDCLFTGTSHPESSSWFEVNFAEQAKQRGIYTISFVEHWVNFQLRFFGKDGRLRGSLRLNRAVKPRPGRHSRNPGLNLASPNRSIGSPRIKCFTSLAISLWSL